MATMKANEIKESAKRTVLGMLESVLENNSAERYGSEFNQAIPVTIDGQEIWVKVDITCAQYIDTKVSKAFDPFVKRAEYDEELAIKAHEKELKAKARAEKKAQK